jgi:hypothetical protein
VKWQSNRAVRDLAREATRYAENETRPNPSEPILHWEFVGHTSLTCSSIVPILGSYVTIEGTPILWK